MIQPNTTGRVVWLAYDCDVPGSAVEWHNWNAPPPTLAMENPVNGHAHLVYALEAPVPTTDASRRKPLLYLAAVNEGLRRTVKGDMGYTGRLMKTPGHPAWRTTSYAGTYSLADLADYVELPSPRELLKKARNPDYAGLGRNCTLFERLRTYSYSAARNHWRPGGYERFLLDLEHRAIEINLRKGGTTHPFRTLQFLTGGRYDPETGLFQSGTGNPKYYFASDNLESEKYRGLLPEDLIDITTYTGLHYNSSSNTGVVFHMIGALSQYGKLGVTCVGNSPEEAEALYERTLQTLDRECRSTRWMV